MCTNTQGSFTCSCATGYILDIDNRTCNGKDKLQWSRNWGLGGGGGGGEGRGARPPSLFLSGDLTPSQFFHGSA